MIDCGPRLRPSVRVNRIIEAPPGVVFTAFTDAGLLWRWFAPPDHDLTEADVDARVGGEFKTVATAPDGSRHVTTGAFRELQPSRRIVVSWSHDGSDDPAAVSQPESVMTITLAERRGGLTDFTLVVEQVKPISSGRCDRNARNHWDEELEDFANAMADLVAGAFRGAVVESFGARDKASNVVDALLTEHLGCRPDPDHVSIVSDHHLAFLEVGLQAALDEFLAEPGRSHHIVGVDSPTVRSKSYDGDELSLPTVLASPTLSSAPVVLVAPEYALRPSGWDESVPCLVQGLVLFTDDDGPGVFWLRGRSNRMVHVDLLHPSAERARAILERLRMRSADLNPYRGKVFHVRSGPSAGPEIEFRPRPRHTEADEVVLPPGLLDEIEEHSIGAIRAHNALVASGRHFKRGLLLHGRPGTGKTHTIRYLISQMPEVTVVALGGDRMIEGVEMIQSMVELIVPAVIVLDDVDLIAEDRSRPGLSGPRDSLFALLELLDGMSDDADLLFVLTTNRPNTLEPAIAARPGRIDQAIEVPLPDADCRRRLLDLYTRDLVVEVEDTADLRAFVERTHGVTASFIREAVRRAAVAAMLADRAEAVACADGAGAGAGEGRAVASVDSLDQVPLRITTGALLRALDQLLDPANVLTPLLLGAEPEHAGPMLAAVAECRQPPTL